MASSYRDMPSRLWYYDDFHIDGVLSVPASAGNLQSSWCKLRLLVCTLLYRNMVRETTCLGLWSRFQRLVTRWRCIPNHVVSALAYYRVRMVSAYLWIYHPRTPDHCQPDCPIENTKCSAASEAERSYESVFGGTVYLAYAGILLRILRHVCANQLCRCRGSGGRSQPQPSWVLIDYT